MTKEKLSTFSFLFEDVVLFSLPAHDFLSFSSWH